MNDRWWRPKGLGLTLINAATFGASYNIITCKTVKGTKMDSHVPHQYSGTLTTHYFSCKLANLHLLSFVLSVSAFSATGVQIIVRFSISEILSLRFGIMTKLKKYRFSNYTK